MQGKEPGVVPCSLEDSRPVEDSQPVEDTQPVEDSRPVEDSQAVVGGTQPVEDSLVGVEVGRCKGGRDVRM